MSAVTALLPMKGHSERVPGKNLRPIAGRPLYHWIARALVAATSVDTVVVDTDSDEIAADVSREFPAFEVHERPEHLQGDFVPMHDIVAYLAAVWPGDIFLQTHATNPLLTAATIDAAVESFAGQQTYDSLMSVTRWQTRLYSEDGTPLNHDPNELLRTQDLAALLEENSNIYIAPREVVEDTGRRIGSRPMLFEIARHEAVDIDEPLDFIIAECLLERAHGGP